MNFDENPEMLRLRPHHIFCSRFLPLHLLVRGEDFARAMDEVRELTEAENDLVVVVTEGPDQLCVHCPDLKNDRCENPAGEEERVGRWDARIMEGLAISYGERITVKEMLALVREKAPLEFCRTRCPWKAFCEV